MGNHVLESIKKTGVALKGPLTNVLGTEFPRPNGYLRKTLGLFANLRLAKSFPGVVSRFQDVDLAVVRETTEDVYRGQEQMIGEDAAVGIRFTTRQGARRVIRFAFDFAVSEGRKKVTVFLKANVLKLTDGLFLREARAVAGEYPQVEFEEMNVDAQCLELVRKPEAYDVLVMPNLYGDIIADLAGGLVGSVGICPGVNYGDGIGVFEPAHGSAPKYAGLNVVTYVRCGNPVADRDLNRFTAFCFQRASLLCVALATPLASDDKGCCSHPLAIFFKIRPGLTCGFAGKDSRKFFTPVSERFGASGYRFKSGGIEIAPV